MIPFYRREQALARLVGRIPGCSIKKEGDRIVVSRGGVDLSANIYDPREYQSLYTRLNNITKRLYGTE